MVIEDLTLYKSVCNHLLDMTKVKKFTLGNVVHNDEDNENYIIVGLTVKNIENYARFVYVLLSYKTLFSGVQKENNRYLYVRAEEMNKSYETVDRFPLNKEMIESLDRDFLLTYSITMNLIEIFSGIKNGTLLEYANGVWYSLILETQNDYFVAIDIEENMITKSFKDLEGYIIEKVKLGKLYRIEAMYQRYNTKVVKQFNEHEVSILVNKLKLLELYEE